MQSSLEGSPALATPDGWPPGSVQISSHRLDMGLPIGMRICVMWDNGWEFGTVTVTTLPYSDKISESSR